MKVALVLEQFDARRGGLEQWTARFANELILRGHQVHVVASRFGPESHSMPIVAHPLGEVGPRLAFAEAAAAKLLTLDVDVIHDMGAGWYCDVFHPHGGSWSSVTERKMLLKPRWMRPVKRWVDRLLRRQREYHALLSRQYADHGQLLVALSQTVSDDFREFHGVPDERIRIVYNGVDPDQFSPTHQAEYRQEYRRQLGVDDRTLLALIVAHNFRLKGVPALLQAVSQLHREGLPVHLAVVGGKRFRPWRRMATRLGIERAVSFLGPKDPTVPYYAAADVYVHPTFYDTCSLVVLEAAASGLPIITSRLNGASELMSDQTEGRLLWDPADADELTRLMKGMFDESRRHSMGVAAREMALRHTLRRNVEEILAVYGEVIGSRVDRSALRRLPDSVGRRSSGPSVGQLR